MASRVIYLLTPVDDQTVGRLAGNTIIVDSVCSPEWQSKWDRNPSTVVAAGPDVARDILSIDSLLPVVRITPGTEENAGRVRQEWDVLIREGVEVSVAPAAHYPLFGNRVLVMRPAGRGAGLISSLEELGAIVVNWPAIEILPPENWRTLDEAIARLAETNWVVFASIHGIEAFLGRLRDTGCDVASLSGVNFAAVGPSTAYALSAAGVRVDLVPAIHSADGLVAELAPLIQGGRVLVIRADRGRDTLERALSTVARVESVIAYRQLDREPPPQVVKLLDQGLIDNALVTSSNTARVLARACQGLRSGVAGVGVVALSPITAQTCREVGLHLAGTADEASDDGLIRELLQIRSRSAFQPR